MKGLIAKVYWFALGGLIANQGANSGIDSALNALALGVMAWCLAALIAVNLQE